MIIEVESRYVASVVIFLEECKERGKFGYLKAALSLDHIINALSFCSASYSGVRLIVL